MIRTIVRAYSLEIPDEDIVRMRTHWRNARSLGDLSDGAEIDTMNVEIQALVDLTDNGNRSFNEWLYMAYEVASQEVDTGDHSGALYWSPRVGGWSVSEWLNTDEVDVPATFDFGPITYLFHGYDCDVEAEGEDKFNEGIDDN